MKAKNAKRGTPDGRAHGSGGHRRLRLTGPTLIMGVAVESKARAILREKRLARIGHEG